VLQRVRQASVTVGADVVAEIGPGVLVLLGVAKGDTADESVRFAGKVARLRIFESDEGRFDRSLLDVSGEALVVSQFTLIADTRKGIDRASPTQPPRRSPSRSTRASARRSRARAFALRAAPSARACGCRS
jgi:D-tyrosyl-tRNA(Tyr) deacylase